jgi:hypothetical protein
MINKFLLNKILYSWLFLLCSFLSFAQTGNHVFSGAEANNFGVVDLATPGGQTWSTDRQAIPGYFSASGTASYSSPSDAHNVNGYVKHYATAANQSFSYPVGSGTDYRNLSISGTRTDTSTAYSKYSRFKCLW